MIAGQDAIDWYLKEIDKLKKQLVDLQRTNTELNTLWRADRAELTRLHAELRYYLGKKADVILLDGEHAQYELTVEEVT